jgi:hypothetical protein
VFFVRQGAPDRARSELLSLRPSLNSPVVVMDEIPTGPARAAIAALDGPAGARVALAIRSERTGQVLFFGPDDELREWQGDGLALEAALSFAEGLGFLFDEDRMVEAPGEAARLWEELLEACAPGGSPAERRAAPPSSEPAAEIRPDALGAAGSAGAGCSVTLTKFRGRSSGAGSAHRRGPAARSPARQPLGRFRVASTGRRP